MSERRTDGEKNREGAGRGGGGKRDTIIDSTNLFEYHCFSFTIPQALIPYMGRPYKCFLTNEQFSIVNKVTAN